MGSRMEEYNKKEQHRQLQELLKKEENQNVENDLSLPSVLSCNLAAYYHHQNVPTEFLEHYILGKEGNASDSYNKPIGNRFVRLNPRFNKDETLTLLKVRYSN